MDSPKPNPPGRSSLRDGEDQSGAVGITETSPESILTR